MINAIIFDLDGTLVQSGKIKAQSSAIAVQRMRGLAEPEPRAIEAYREIVGSAWEAATRHVIEICLEYESRPLMAQHGAKEPWEALAGMRTEIYDNMVEDPQVLRDNQWPHTIGLLRVIRERFCRTALATMSYRKEALHVLRSLELEDSLDEVLTSGDVQNPKPDPEIYLLAAQKLEVDPQCCLLLEDSPNGV